MWLKNLVGVTLGVASLALIFVMLYGTIWYHPPNKKPAFDLGAGDPAVVEPLAVIAEWKVDPVSSAQSSFTTQITWKISDGLKEPVSCNAASTPANSEWNNPTKPTSGTQAVKVSAATTFVLVCHDASALSDAKYQLVKPASTTPPPTPAGGGGGGTKTVYCGGSSGCVGKATLASHGSSNGGNSCWAYSKYHSAKSYAAVYSLDALVFTSGHGDKGLGVSSYKAECGKDMTSCLDGSGGCGNSRRNHTTSDFNVYSSQAFVGYFDPNKP